MRSLDPNSAAPPGASTWIRAFSAPTRADRECALEEDVVDALAALVRGYGFLPGGGIHTVGIAVHCNARVHGRRGVRVNDRCFLLYGDFPEGVSKTQETKDAVMRARIQALLSRFRSIPNSPVRSLVVEVLYNTRESDYIPCGIEPRKGNLNEESLPFFEPQRPRFRLDQVILGPGLRESILRTLSVLRLREKIYVDWGFGEIDPEPRAVLNLFGPPGTGKTMTAHAIAAELGTRILALNYADIESKFVGDAPKNLVRAFETAEAEQALLFFDEADSFLGRRISSVSSSSDQAVNSLRSQMFILLEGFSGAVVFATNLVSNYDRAFESRIFRHLRFELPGADERLAIIENTLPSRAPIEDNELTVERKVELATTADGFSGREIKNAILDALTRAAERGGERILFEDLETSFLARRETRAELAEENEERSRLTVGRKTALEDKIRKGLGSESSPQPQDSCLRPAFAKALMTIAEHAAWADGVLGRV